MTIHHSSIEPSRSSQHQDGHDADGEDAVDPDSGTLEDAEQQGAGVGEQDEHHDEDQQSRSTAA